MRHLLQLLLLVTCLIHSTVKAEVPLEKVSIQFEWLYQFQYAGFIAAKEKGFYQEAGLDVTLKEYSAGSNVVDQVLNRKANYGIHNSQLVFDGEALVPVVMLASYFQHSPLIIVAHPSIQSPADLIGKKVMGTSDELKHSSLALMLNHFSVNHDNSTLVEHSFNIDDFAEGRVDAMSAFRSNQLFELDRRGIPYTVFDPADYGFYTSAVNLYASRDEVLEHRERSERLIEATRKGWAYALDHPEEMVEIIYQHYSQRKSREALQYEAEVTQKLVLKELFPIGWISEELGKRLIVQLKHSNMLAPETEERVLTYDRFKRFGQDKMVLTREEKRYLLEKGSIRYCVDPDWMPLEAIHDGKHVGIAGEVIAKLETMLPVPLELVETPSWADSLTAVKQGACDLLSLAASTPEHEQYLQFTEPYLSQPLVMVTQVDKPFTESLSMLERTTIGVVEGYYAEEYLLQHYPNHNIVSVRSINEGIEKVSSGELYGYVDNMVSVASLVQHQYGGLLKISARLDEILALAVAVRKEEPILQKIFDDAVERINSDPKEKQAIINGWISVKYETIDDRNYDLVVKIVVVLVLVLFLLLYRHQILSDSRKKLQQAKNEIDLIVDTMGEGIAVIDQQGLVVHINHRFEVMSGYSLYDLKGSKVSQLFVEESASEQMQPLLEDLSIPLSHLFDRHCDEFQQLCSDSSLGILLVDEEGVIQLANRAFTDLSDWQAQALVGGTLDKLLPAPIQGSHKQMMAQFMASPESRKMGNRLLPLVMASGKTKEVDLGLIPLQGRDNAHVLVLAHDPRDQRALELFRISTLGRLVEETTDRIHLQYELRQASGDKLPVNVTVAMLEERSEVKEGTAAVLVVHDATEQIKQAHRDQYEAFQSGLNEMSATVLHNIGNAVTAVNTEVSNFRTKVGQLDQVSDALKFQHKKLEQGEITAEEFGERMKVIGNAITTINHGEEGNRNNRGIAESTKKLDIGLRHVAEIVKSFREHSSQEFRSNRFNLHQLVKDTADLIDGGLHKANVELQIHVPRDIELNVPRNLTMQMVLNLTKNSLEAIIRKRQWAPMERPLIQISADTKGEEIVLMVEDNGCGVPESLQSELFTRGVTSKEGGAGLGLHSIANFMVNLKGGVRLESEGEDCGAKVYVTFPKGKEASPE